MILATLDLVGGHQKLNVYNRLVDGINFLKNMKQYEIMNIYKLELGEQGAKELSDKVHEALESGGAKVTGSNFWGKRKFAYEIKKQREGFYEVINFEIEPSKLKKLESKIKLMTGVLRYLITAQS